MAYTTTGSLSYDTVAYELAMRYSYRPELFWANQGDVRSTNTTHRGSSVRFFIQSDMAVATTPLTEDVDVTPVALANSSVDVTLLEYGNATVTTARLAATSMFDIDSIAANVIGYNAGVSLDTVARDVWAAGTNIRYAQGDAAAVPAARVNVNYGAATARHTLRAVDVRRAFAELRGQNVPTVQGYYLAHIHPDVAFDLKSETGEAGWRAPHVYSAPENIFNGEIGAFEGFRFIETPRAPLFADAGVGATVDVYRTIFSGREAVAKAYSTGGGYGAEPVVVMGPVVDTLRRFQPIGWKWFGGWSLFRSAAMRAVESSSSIGANT